jgi:hypothetical protein
MHLHDGDIHVGIVPPVILQRDGTTVLFQHMIAGETVGRDKLAVRKLALLEVSAHVAEHVPEVRTIRFALSSRVKEVDDGMKLASARSAMLRGIGVPKVKVTPNPAPGFTGQFIVEGLWTRSPKSLAALRAALEEERIAYARRKAAARGSWWARLVAKITNFLMHVAGADSRSQSW